MSRMNKLLLVNGPNLNLLGKREPDKYGRESLEEIEEELQTMAKQVGISLQSFQSNSEGALVDFIQREGQVSDGMIINAGAYTHTSIAIRDAILAVQIPFVEVHLSNVYRRESFRHHSYLSDIAIGVIAGFGKKSYELAMLSMVDFLEKNQ